MTEVTSDAGLVSLPRGTGVRRLVVALSLALVLLAAGASLFLLRGVDGQLGDLQRAQAVREQAQQLILALVDAETAQRGYLLTLDPQYLAPYDQAAARVEATYQQLLAQVEGTPDQRSAIAALGPLVERKTGEMADTIELARAGQLAEALAIMRSDEGQRMITALRSGPTTFIAGEDGTLAERNAAVQSYRNWLVLAILAALAGAAILAYSLIARTQKRYSSLARASTQLLSQNEQLEHHVRERTAEAEEARAHAERERARVEAVLQDTNHRIGNSLATVSSLLGLQVARTQSDEVRRALDAAQARVHAIASSHRRLRLGADLETIKVDEFLTLVLEDLRITHASGREVQFDGNFEPLTIHARDATTIGIMLGELVTNALKHAFADTGDGRIWVHFYLDGDVTVLAVEDNGRGLGGQAAQSETGLGAMILKQLARQFGGTADYSERQGGGTRVSITLPELQREPAHP